MSKRSKQSLLTFAALISLCVACTGVPIAGDLIAGLFATHRVTVVIENKTDFFATPDIRTSNSRNGLEDLFDEGTTVTEFGTGGAIPPSETVSFAIPCDGDLETIYFGGASFRDGNNLPFGDVNRYRTLRRDGEFDCGDVIRIRLSGSLFDFSAKVSVEQPVDAASPWSASGDDNDRRPPEADDDDDIADFLDDLFN